MTPTELLTGVTAVAGFTVGVYALERVRLLAGLHHQRKHPEPPPPPPIMQPPPGGRPWWGDGDRTEVLRTVAEAPPTAPQAAPPGWRPPTAGWGGAGHGQ